MFTVAPLDWPATREIRSLPFLIYTLSEKKDIK